MTIPYAENRIRRTLPNGPGKGPGIAYLALAAASKQCRVPGCSDRIDLSRLMCRHHWYLVPKLLRGLGMGDLGVRLWRAHPCAPGSSMRGDTVVPGWPSRWESRSGTSIQARRSRRRPRRHRAPPTASDTDRPFMCPVCVMGLTRFGGHGVFN
jgi:hypothetical protein